MTLKRDLSLRWGIVAATTALVGFAVLKLGGTNRDTWLWMILCTFAAVSIGAVAFNREKADTDSLTMTRTKSAGEEILAELLKSGQPVSVLFMDVNHFKRINSQITHMMANQVLVWMANTIRSIIRRTGDVVVRFGGDEFVVILPGAGLAAATALAERIRASLDTPLEVGGDKLWVPGHEDARHHTESAHDVQTIQMGVTIGVAESYAGATVEGLLAVANRRLVRGKEELGRNCVVSED
jgi:diguanylate cyclase (GGDEF)-like protein